ncbi:uncharacterized protein E0L32_010157 [Thyridium curvatum]|uniref:Uncharacterized protein n=1 Tax=Thyridium curvatum TaxID=1093900 RepID=A0A507AME8_9PEZI|nr:uncharacterized protein E0L32_010157 [Thyridium curvatum]TPX08427.1 hypothetical protein E0L32_010157 [Thyridium curvatum]
MPSFFSFQQGNEARALFPADASPLLGRFRAVPRPLGGGGYAGGGLGAAQQRGGQINAAWRGSVHIGYGAVLAQQLEDEEDDETGDEDGLSDDDEGGLGCVGRCHKLGRRTWRWVNDLWITPKQSAVKRVVNSWWNRWTLLVVLPAALAIAWCALPFPQYPLPGSPETPDPDNPPRNGGKVPGHGEARVQVNFWFFLFVYYGCYSLTALIWITKVFNLYSLNWWPKSLGFPVTITLIALLSIAAPMPVYLIPESRWLTVHNTAWITWTFFIMAMPVLIAFCILMTHERHLGLRHSLSETQRIFTSSWWTGEPDTLPRRESRRRGRAWMHQQNNMGDDFDSDAALQVAAVSDMGPASRRGVVPVAMRRRWLPASFIRFIWFCLALFIGLLVYVIGEAYAEIYLRTLPHNNLETIVYVYGWVATVHLLDGLTGWILGGNEGERVGSYPLSWIFKLYFMLTYQTYVRALYARLRSPSQFIWLQALSSFFLITITPLFMSRPAHRCLTLLSLNAQSYGAYHKTCVRNVFVRFLAENASMLAFLGSILVLHFGANKDVYPYFAFDGGQQGGGGGGGGDGDGYDFNLTFYASSVTWACELAASFVVAGLIRWIYGVSVVVEGKLDLAVWPELLPTSVAVILHVLQNMLFSIARLQFH